MIGSFIGCRIIEVIFERITSEAPCGITKVIHHNFDAFCVVALAIFSMRSCFAAFVMEIGIVKERIVD